MNSFQSEISKVMEYLKNSSRRRSNCLKRKVGAAVVEIDPNGLGILGKLISIGFNSSPVGLQPCKTCGRAGFNAGQNPYLCRVVHAEAKAIMDAYKSKKSRLVDCILITTLFPCAYCSDIIIDSGVEGVYYGEDYYGTKETETIIDKFGEANIIIRKLDSVG